MDGSTFFFHEVAAVDENCDTVAEAMYVNWELVGEGEELGLLEAAHQAGFEGNVRVNLEVGYWEHEMDAADLLEHFDEMFPERMGALEEYCRFIPPLGFKGM